MAGAEARQNLIDAIRAYEQECGDDPRYREVKADLVNLERSLPPAEDDERQPRKTFDDVAESHRQRLEEKSSSSSSSNDDQAPSDKGTGYSEGDDKPDGERPMRKRRG